MTYFIQIDRSTFKKNPRAGQTEHTESGPTRATVTVERDGTRQEWENYGAVTDNCGPQAEMQFTAEWIMVAMSGPAPQQDGNHLYVGVPGMILSRRTFSSQMEGVKLDAHRDVQTYRHHPEPEWLYEYVPTPVTCDECGETFPNTELQETDSLDYFNNRVCPKCGEPDCCEVRYEEPAAVALELGLRAVGARAIG